MVRVVDPLSATPPTCSVCVANFNGEDVVAACIDSILAQHADATIEIIVHDDASTDRSLDVLSGFTQIVRMDNATNVGFCIANNRMVAHARGTYVLLLNNDAELMEGALQALLDAAKESPNAVLTLPQYDWESGALVDRGCLLDPFYNPVPNIDPRRSEVAMGIGACLWLPRDLWNAIGGFPEWMGSVAEDVYLCCAARLTGVTVRVAPASGYRHHQGFSFGGNRVDSGRLVSTYRRRRLSESNKLAVLLICTPAQWWWVLLSLHLPMLVIEGGLLALLRWDRRVWVEIYWTSFTETFARRCLIGLERQRVQSRRRAALTSYFTAFTWRPRKVIMLLRHGLPRIHDTRPQTP